MSRRYPTAELYDERQREFYRGGNRSNRSYDELDVELRESSRRSEHGDPRHSQPDFLRDDYGHTTAGPLALRKSRTDDFDRRSVSTHSRPTRDVRDIEKDEVIIRNERRTGPPPRETGSIRFQERPGPPPPREVAKDEIIYRRREEDVESRATSRRPPPREDDVASVRTNHTKATRGRDVDREEIIIRREESRGPPPSKAATRDSDREDILFRRGNGPRNAPGPPPSNRGGDVERDEFIFRREEREAGPPGKRGDIERDEFIFRHDERSSSPPPPPKSRRGEVEKDEVIIRREERSRGPSRREEDLTIRTRERSLPPPRLVAREREDFVLKRREQRPPSPPSPPHAHVQKQEIVIRRTERSPSPSPSRSPTPPPPPPPEPILRPPIIQEIITHHRHIDHGVERVREPSPPPPPPSPPKEEDLEISIRRRTTDGRTYEEDFTFESNRERDVKPERRRPEKKFKEPRREVSSSERIEINATHDDSSGDEKNFELSITRQRSQSAAAPPSREIAAPRRRGYEDDIQAEADFYNRKAEERGHHGEAYNGATKDWALVDVPPGTRRVRMDGQGGAGQEISWDRYSGGRRSKFITEDGEYASEFGRPSHNHKAIAPPPPSKTKEDMWTEVTKDLVIEDAIKSMGYQYEETESFYYIMEYLRYEDVLQLVELSDDIRRDRRSRIREIQWEREEIRPAPPKPGYDEHIYEREVIYDSRGRRHK